MHKGSCYRHVHPTLLQDRAAVPLVLEAIDERFPHIELLWAGQGYTGGCGAPHVSSPSQPTFR